MNDTTDQPIKVEQSIVDTILDLDAFLSADVRLAEETVPFFTKPHLVDQIKQADADLKQRLDSSPSSFVVLDRTLGDEGEQLIYSPDLVELAEKIEALRSELAASKRTMRLRQMDSNDWRAFRLKWRDALNEGTPYPDDLLDELLAASSIAPKMTPEKVTLLRARLGGPVVDELTYAAVGLNTSTGVSVPKSLASSLVLKRVGHEQN